MAVKYTIPYRDDKNNPWRIDISTDSYSGEAIQLRVADGAAATITHRTSEDPYEPIILSSASVTVVNYEGGAMDVDELQQATDREFRMQVYKNNVLEWSGFVTPDQIQDTYGPMPYDVYLTATDGLKYLEGTIYNTGNFPLPSPVVNRSVISHIRDILFNTQQLNLRLPIRWVSGVENISVPGDAIGVVPFSIRGEAYTDFNGNEYSSYFLLENLLRSFQLRLYQSGGKWRIERVNDIVSGTFDWSEISTEYGSGTATYTSGTETRLVNIGSSGMMPSTDGVILGSPGLKSYRTTYEANMPENVLPNGSFELQDIVGNPFYWGMENGLSDFNMQPSLVDRSGESVMFSFGAANPNQGRIDLFRLNNGVPIDTHTLFKRIDFGFTFSPTEFGFPLDGNGLINWDSSPFMIRVTLTYGNNFDGDTYFLNQFGWWQKEATVIDDRVEFYNTTETINWDLGTRTTRLYFRGSPQQGDIVGAATRSSPGGNFNWYNHTVTAGQVGNLQSVLNSVASLIPTSNSQRNVVMTGANEGHIVITMFTYYATPQAMVQLSGASGGLRLIPIRIDGMKPGDVAQVSFDRFQGIKLPDLGEDFVDKVAKLNVWFQVKEGQAYAIDDVYIRVDRNFDVYESEKVSSQYTKKDEGTIHISSSFSGFMKSNFMRNYWQSNSDYVFNDGKYEGPLTGMNSNAIMRFRHLHSKIFEGTLEVGDYQYGSIVEIDGYSGKKFLPLSSTHNTQKCQVKLTAMECRDDDLLSELTEKHYGSNDLPLSNEIS